MAKKFKKITTGFVVQDYEEKNGRFVCVGQEFIAGDQVDYEDEMGESVEVDTLKEDYQPFDMVQPE